MINETDFCRISSDTNGNSRYITHYLYLLTMQERMALSSIDQFNIALSRAHSVGGKKYKARHATGFLVFQEYSGLLPALADRINQLMNP